MLHSPDFDKTFLAAFATGPLEVPLGDVEQEIAATAQNKARSSGRM
jgi:hypothetical protein